MSINSIVFTGNCGADMEIRHTPKGVAIGTVNVAAKSGWGDNQKQHGCAVPLRLPRRGLPTLW